MEIKILILFLAIHDPKNPPAIKTAIAVSSPVSATTSNRNIIIKPKQGGKAMTLAKVVSGTGSVATISSPIQSQTATIVTTVSGATSIVTTTYAASPINTPTVTSSYVSILEINHNRSCTKYNYVLYILYFKYATIYIKV